MRPLLLFCLVFFFNLNYSQNQELGKVTIDELKEKVCPIDTSAVAAIIFKNAKIIYHSDGEVTDEVEVKLKIYKKEGYDFANIDERYFDVSGGETLKFSDAVVYNLLNGEIVKTSLKKNDGQFKEETTKNISTKKIIFPDVKEGTIVEYKIKKITHNKFILVNFYFQDEIPIKNIQLTVEYSDRYYYSKNLTGYLNPVVKTETLTDYNDYRFLKNRITYSLNNVPPIKDEGFVNNINNYRSRIRYELASVKDNISVSYNISTDWTTVAKRIYQSESFGDELNKSSYFEKELEEKLKNVLTIDDKIDVIFSFVKDKMNWDESNGIFCNDGVRAAYKNRKGNAAEINLMLTAMLRFAGLQANPILISTRKHLIGFFPSISAFNFVICGVEIGGKTVLLDATSKFSLPNILPIRDLNWIGRMIRKNGSSVQVDLMPKSNSREVFNIMASINEQGEVAGKIRDQYFDYDAFQYRDSNNAIDKDSYIEELEKKHQGLEIAEYDVQNKNELSKPIIENYSFINNNSVEMIGDKMYFSPFLFFATTENPFKQETREYPIDFVYPNQKKFNISINIPKGYVVETLPSAKAMTMPDELGNFKYNIVSNGNQIQLLYNLDINQAIISADYYEILKTFFKEIVDKQTEKIVLKRG